jgi:vancomycin aglycone glucosyltransferase
VRVRAAVAALRSAGAAGHAVPGGRDRPRGIGAAHGRSAPTFDSLSAALATALAPAARYRAEAVAGTIRTDGTAVAAKLLLDP